MNNKVFGELTYDVGWKAKTKITFFSKEMEVTVKFKAYEATDGITEQQEKSACEFNSMKTKKLAAAEKMLNKYFKNEIPSGYAPKTLLFERDGGYALLLDSYDDENGIAIILGPNEEIMTQDEYL